MTIAHKYGSMDIATAPARIFAVGLTEQDALLAFGITPVGATEWLVRSPLVWATLRGRTSRRLPLESYTSALGGATSFVSVLSLPYLLDGLMPQLDAALDGDPATTSAL